MLVLTRREGEGLQIGDNITVHVLRSANGETKVGIEAPREVNIARLELLGGNGRSGARGERK